MCRRVSPAIRGSSPDSTACGLDDDCGVYINPQILPLELTRWLKWPRSMSDHKEKRSPRLDGRPCIESSARMSRCDVDDNKRLENDPTRHDHSAEHGHDHSGHSHGGAGHTHGVS